MRLILTFLLLFNLGYCQLIQTHWHESFPYNVYCPMYNGEHTYAGNRSVIVAQVLNYWKHPNYGWGNIQYQNYWTGIVSTDFEVYLDWFDVLDVEELIFKAGASCQHQFSPYLQNSMCDIINLDTIKRALHDYWGYNSFISNDFYSVATDIDQGHPVIMEAYPDPPSLGCSRYFILDGYNNGLYHVNNGFGGLFDGWYDISSIQFLNATYATNMRFLIGIEPDTMTVSGSVVYEGTNDALSGQIDSIHFSHNFSFTTIKRWYDPQVEISDPVRGINAVDALAIARYYVQYDSIINYFVADVNGDYNINSIDCMLTLQKFVGYPVQFYDKFFCDTPVINNDTTITIRCRCVGDVKP